MHSECVYITREDEFIQKRKCGKCGDNFSDCENEWTTVSDVDRLVDLDWSSYA